jgi:hypothetical protein
VYRLIVRDTKAYLDVMRALSMLPKFSPEKNAYDGVLMTREIIMKESFGLSSEWNYCAYIKQNYIAIRSGENKPECVAWKKIKTRPNDPTFAVMGRRFTLEKGIVVTNSAKFKRMYQRILENVGLAPWLSVCPDLAYLQAMQNNPESAVADIAKLYEFMFYLCLENCSANTPETGVVLLRDSVSQKPLTFHVKNADVFIKKTLSILHPPPYPHSEKISYITLDLTCISPIVVTPLSNSHESEYGKPDACDSVLKTLRAKRIDASGHSVAGIIRNFLTETDDDDKILSDESNILHLSLYTPAYI